MFIDEPQYLQADQFGALISALHRCATIRQLITSAFANADLGRNHARLGQMRSWDGRQTIGGVSNSKTLASAMLWRAGSSLRESQLHHSQRTR